MAITRVSNSSVISNTPKKRSVLAGNDPIYAGSYESISTAVVTSGGTASVTFSSIPQTYSHLQIRGISRSDRAITGGNVLIMRFNGDSNSGNYYSTHNIVGDGTNAYAQSIATVGASGIWGGISTGNTTAANIFAVFNTDILDYTSANKTKSTRSLQGIDNNSTGGQIAFVSGLWLVTPTAITSITLVDNTGHNFMQYSSFALYGIK